MDNPNFVFLKEDSPEYYEKCCQVDLLIAMGLYDKSIVSSRQIIESIVSPTEGYDLFGYLKEYGDSSFEKTTLDYMHDIRIQGNDAVHNIDLKWTK